jgi:predicted secreted Zn-dependent protease
MRISVLAILTGSCAAGVAAAGWMTGGFVTLAAAADFVIAPPTLTPYTILGTTDAELRSQMNALGPFSSTEGKRFDAVTRWAISANWPPLKSVPGVGCQFPSITVTVKTNFSLPNWTPPAGTPPALVTRWQTYMAALQAHENGHKQLGIDAGTDFLNQLKSMPAAPNCTALVAAAKAKKNAVEATFRQKHQAYDKATNHGATQGATFP